MDQRTRDAIRNVINYLWDDELRDYNEQDGDGKQNHIFNELEYLDNLLLSEGSRFSRG